MGPPLPVLLLPSIDGTDEEAAAGWGVHASSKRSSRGKRRSRDGSAPPLEKGGMASLLSQATRTQPPRLAVCVRIMDGM